MAIVGVKITKIDAEKKESKGGKININNNVSITGIDIKDLALGTSKQKGLKFNFSFKCNYEPGVGNINFEGHIIYLTDADKVKSIKEGWDKDKKMPPEIMEPLLNSALNKCNIEAIKISQDLNLPVPVPMPRLQKAESKPKGPKKVAK